MRRAWIPSLALLLTALAASQAGAVSAVLTEEPSGTTRAAATTRQATTDAANPCTGPNAARLACPDLMMRRPFGLELERSPAGKRLLRAGNSIDNVGDGPAALRGTRNSERFMEAVQLIRRRDGGTRVVDTPGRLEYKRAHQDLRFWKFHDAAKFELWGLDASGKKTAVVRTGPKVAYCLRDLERTRPSLKGAPKRAVYPACSTKPRIAGVTLGTSVGWSDVYPPAYPEQWIDVTGLKGCFAYVHTADPGDAIHETDEDNNVSQVIVRLPFRKKAPRGSCPGRQFGVPYRKTGADITPW